MTLVIVHPTRLYMDVETSQERREAYAALFERIAQEMDAYRTMRGSLVLGFCDPFESLYPAIRERTTEETFIPDPHGTEAQFLVTKERLLEDPEIAIAGAVFNTCVADFAALLDGRIGPHVSEEAYRRAANLLGWRQAYLDRVLPKRLPARVLRELTDADIPE